MSSDFIPELTRETSGIALALFTNREIYNFGQIEWSSNLLKHYCVCVF